MNPVKMFSVPNENGRTGLVGQTAGFQTQLATAVAARVVEINVRTVQQTNQTVAIDCACQVGARVLNVDLGIGIATEGAAVDQLPHVVQPQRAAIDRLDQVVVVDAQPIGTAIQFQRLAGRVGANDALVHQRLVVAAGVVDLTRATLDDVVRGPLVRVRSAAMLIR